MSFEQLSLVGLNLIVEADFGGEEVLWVKERIQLQTRRRLWTPADHAA
jgi:hypothetical protein